MVKKRSESQPEFFIQKFGEDDLDEILEEEMDWNEYVKSDASRLGSLGEHIKARQTSASAPKKRKIKSG
ncbi:MAG: hypothetical protein COV44_08165 [Deltaproteobacteria bacterium CG11_big_fil_rev_8_21_14_0_20_45_16]|nr:MAG: hypothetical protein COV44_08165 [Deltaproteobacteria bacterium CG11_big_fil_rev_8_21_14_0_20_45_16]